MIAAPSSASDDVLIVSSRSLVSSKARDCALEVALGRVVEAPALPGAHGRQLEEDDAHGRGRGQAEQRGHDARRR